MEVEEFDSEAEALTRLAEINSLLDWDRAASDVVSKRQTTTDWAAAPVFNGSKWTLPAFTNPPAGLPAPVLPSGPTQVEWEAMDWTASHKGTPLPNLALYDRVFHCDFSDSSSVAGEHANPLGGALFYTPGHPGASQRHWRSILTHPECYEFLNPGIRLWCRVTSQSDYDCGNLMSTNRFGRGRTFNKGIFRVRFKAQYHAATFPAFWMRQVEFLLPSAAPNVELDGFEFDGGNRDWFNKTFHWWKSNSPRPFPGGPTTQWDSNNENDYELTGAGPWIGTVDFFDGEHDFSFEMNDDWCISYYDDLEVARHPSFTALNSKDYVLLASQQVLSESLLVAGEDFSTDILKVEFFEKY